MLKQKPLKKHFFSTHLNSDEYPATIIAQFAFRYHSYPGPLADLSLHAMLCRGIKKCSIIWEDSGNAFFEGVGFRAVELVQDRGMDIVVQQQVHSR